LWLLWFTALCGISGNKKLALWLATPRYTPERESTFEEATAMIAKMATTSQRLFLSRCRKPLLRTVTVRNVSSAVSVSSSSSNTQEDLVRATIQKMMQHETPANVTKEALYKASYCLQVRRVEHSHR